MPLQEFLQSLSIPEYVVTPVGESRVDLVHVSGDGRKLTCTCLDRADPNSCRVVASWPTGYDGHIFQVDGFKAEVKVNLTMLPRTAYTRIERKILGDYHAAYPRLLRSCKAHNDAEANRQAVAKRIVTLANPLQAETTQYSYQSINVRSGYLAVIRPNYDGTEIAMELIGLPVDHAVALVEFLKNLPTKS